MTITHRCEEIDGKLFGPSIMPDLVTLPGFETGRLRMEKVRKQDIKKVADGLFDVTYRFTIRPEK